MIRVTVELVPGGVGEPTVIARGEIWNDLERSFQTDHDRGSYKFTFHAGRRLFRRGRLDDFPRKRLNVWYLLARCLSTAGIE